jgi:GNAT superfamily N-acetyltransferase
MKDADAVRELVKATFPKFLGGEYWDWKYLGNPDFDPSLIAVVEGGGEIVGCSHWLRRDFKVGKTIMVNAIFTCDLAVKPEHRGRGIAKKLLLLRRSREMFRKRGLVINYDFSDPKLAKRLYTPLLGYIPIRSSTKTYYRLLSWKKIIEKIEEINTQRKKNNGDFSGSSLNMLLRLRGAPLLTIQINQSSLRAVEGGVESADVVIEGDLATFLSLKEKKKRVKSRLLKAVLTRKIRIKGSLMSLFKFYRSLGVLENVLYVLIASG